MPFFTAPDGFRLHYEVEGSGPPLVLHLGAGADATLWRDAGYLKPLSERFECILFDHRGHGASDHPAGTAENHVDRYAADVVALSQHLRHPKVAFFGWSNAISVGLRAAHLQPDLFNALVLFGGMGRRVPHEQLVVSTAERLKGMHDQGWWYILDDMVAAEQYPVPRWFLNRVAATDTGPWFAYTEARPDWNWSPLGCAARHRVPDPDPGGRARGPR